VLRILSRWSSVLRILSRWSSVLRILFNLLIPSQISNQRAPKGSIYLLGGGAYGRACLRILSMAALSVEHLKVQLTYWVGGRAPPDLMVEHLKVQFTYWVGGLMVEPACAFNLLIPSQISNQRAPPDLNSRACLRILSLMVEHLKVLISRAP